MSVSATLAKPPTTRSRGDRFLSVFAALMLLTAAALLIDPPPQVPMAGGLVRIGRLSTENEVRVRHARRLDWRDETGEVLLFQKDFVYTPPGASAQVELDDGRVIALVSDTLIQFDELALRDLDGAVKQAIAETKRPRSWFRTLPSVKPASAIVTGSLEDLLRTRDIVDKKFEALRRRSAPLIAPKALKPLPRETIRATDFEVQLLSPLPGEQVLPNGTRSLTVSWTPVPVRGVVYEVEIARDAKFKRKVPHRTKATTLKVQLDGGGEYHWRVRAKRGTQKILSAPQSFLFVPEKRGAAAVGAPRRGKSAAYTGEIARDERFTDVVRTDSVASPDCKTKNLKPGKYHCRVRTLSGIQPLREYDFEVK